MKASSKKKKESFVAAEAAVRELSLLMRGMSVEEASEQYYRATDEVERLKTVRVVDDRGGVSGSSNSSSSSSREVVCKDNIIGPKELKSLQKNSSDVSREKGAGADDTIATISPKVQSRANIDTKEVIKSISDNTKGASTSTSTSITPTYLSLCTFIIENLVNISTLNFTLIIPRDAPTASDKFLFSNIDNEKSVPTDSTEQEQIAVQLEDIRLHIETMPGTSGGTDDTNQHRVVVLINSRSKLVDRLTSTTAEHRMEMVEGEYVLASFCLDEHIITSVEDARASLSVTDGRFIAFRLQYHQGGSSSDWEPLDESVLHSIAREIEFTDVGALSNIQCRFCDNLLSWTPPPTPPHYAGKHQLNDHKLEKGVSKHSDDKRNDTESYGIKNVLPLATGNWDEITDYLICYEGQPALNFSSSATAALQGTALEDECAIVLHRLDVRNVCVLAIEGYGEEDTSAAVEKIQEDVAPQPDSKAAARSEDGAQFRGSRAWRDNVGGATICCAQCCSTLGYASIEHPDTFRLLKHRLRARVDIGRTRSSNSFVKNTCGSFIGREIVRYAECQAVYTIVVVSHDTEGLANTHHKNRPCLLIRLLSWNTKVALDRNSRGKDDKEGKEGNNLLEFRRIVKVIYEESDDMLGPLNNSGSPNDWIWGGADLCCFPDEKVKQSSSPVTGDAVENPLKASARIYLAKDEWTELKDSLRVGATYFSAPLSKTTVLLKMGGGYDYKNASLSMLYLP